jgi:ribosomal 50S subunit-associated protein YjgA (DUF615 family)
MTAAQPVLDPDLVDAVRSARRIVSADPRDWGANRHDAFLYGVFRGWDDEVTQSAVAARHGWDAEFVARLHRLQSAVAKALS